MKSDRCKSRNGHGDRCTKRVGHKGHHYALSPSPPYNWGRDEPGRAKATKGKQT